MSFATNALPERDPVSSGMSRRAMLGSLTALGMLLPQRLRALLREPVAEAGNRAVRQLPTRAIPASGERLPIVGFGSSKAVLDIPESGTAPIEAVLRLLVARGGRVVDTSPRTEAIDAQFGPLLGLPDLRDQLFVAAKINADGAPGGIAQMSRMQRLFQRQPLDLLQVESMRDLESHWPNVLGWKESGDVRYIGVTVSSNESHGRMEAFMRSERFDFAHMNYSIFETGAEERLLPLAQDRGMAVLTNRPFMNGEFFRRVEGRPLPAFAADFGCRTWAQFSLKYILSHPAVTCVLTETTNPDHMLENIEAGLGRFPDATERRRMLDVIRAL